MSAPLKLTGQDLQNLATFLAAITAATAEHDITVGAYGPVDVQVTEGNVIAVTWDSDTQQYIVDDRNGT